MYWEWYAYTNKAYITKQHSTKNVTFITIMQSCEVSDCQVQEFPRRLKRVPEISEMKGLEASKELSLPTEKRQYWGKIRRWKARALHEAQSLSESRKLRCYTAQKCSTLPVQNVLPGASNCDDYYEKSARQETRLVATKLACASEMLRFRSVGEAPTAAYTRASIAPAKCQL